MSLTHHIRSKIRRKAAHVACNSPLYNWSLGGAIPEKLLFSPADVWPGNAEYGRWLTSAGCFTLNGDRLELHGANWEPDGIDEIWFSHLHGFDWLKDLKAMGGVKGARSARAMVESWMDHYMSWHPRVWAAGILGRRIANWISAYHFFGECADDEFQCLFLDCLTRQVRHLARVLPGNLSGLSLLYAAKGLAYAGIVLEGREASLEQALSLLHKEIDDFILSDGGPVTRNPQDLMECIQILIDIRAALCQGGYPCPSFVQLVLDRAVPALRFFRHGDRRFALFNGTQEGREDIVKTILLHAGSKAKTLSHLPHTGYERLTQGKSLVIVDTGAPPAWPYDNYAHAAPLAFEFSYGRERIFVSCGSHPTSIDWRDALRATPAHNTLTLDDRNVSEIRPDHSVGRRPRKVTSDRQDMKDACLLDVSHDGYVPLNGITHRRRFYLAENGHDFRGEENLTCTTGLNRAVPVAVRFHVHPSVTVSLVQGGSEVLLRTKGGAGWRFTQCNGTMALEDSLYLGEGAHPRKTRQIVIYSTMQADTLQLKWALQHENAELPF